MAAHARSLQRNTATMLSLRRATTLTARRLSTKAKREYDLVLFGATGYSGRMCADYLLRTHKGLRVALAGRDRAKLEKVAEACMKRVVARWRFQQHRIGKCAVSCSFTFTIGE